MMNSRVNGSLKYADYSRKCITAERLCLIAIRRICYPGGSDSLCKNLSPTGRVMIFLKRVFDIRQTADPENAVRTIQENIPVRGYNMWLLMCAAVLASIGLDTNSTAVIIGAMLISPLMSPILGVGLSLAIQDEQLLTRSLRNLAIATVLSLTMSFLYFKVSPFGNPTTELTARTYPTLLDVMVALFGGIAGIVSASRSGTSNAIPGVAIATALMPPLCTAGYGLATAHWTYFAGAFYLFFINAVFISLATFLIVKLIGFPVHRFATPERTRRYSVLFYLLTFVVTLPSVYFLYTVYQRELVRKKIENLVLIPIRAHGNEILKWELLQKDTATLVKVYHSGPPVSDSMRHFIAKRLQSVSTGHYEILLQRVNMTREEVNALSADVARQLYQQMQSSTTPSSDPEPPQLLEQIQLTKELRIAFPMVDTISYAWLLRPSVNGQTDSLLLFFVRVKGKFNNVSQQQVRNYLATRMKLDTVGILEFP